MFPTEVQTYQKSYNKTLQFSEFSSKFLILKLAEPVTHIPISKEGGGGGGGGGVYKPVVYK